jgi:17 kDa outer membrane surface antigen
LDQGLAGEFAFFYEGQEVDVLVSLGAFRFRGESKPNVQADRRRHPDPGGPLYRTGPGPSWETHIVLTQQDLDMIHAAVTQQVRGKSLGTIVSWSNPASQNSGSIKLVKKLDMRNQKCEVLEYTVRSRICVEHYHFTSCLQPDGTWKIA